jgi:hypothetical protein
MFLCRYGHYEEDLLRKKSKRKKTDDPFTDKYFEIMDRAQEMTLVRSILPPSFAFKIDCITDQTLCHYVSAESRVKCWRKE